jgi:TonB family protein
MKRTILFLLFFLPVILMGQETRKVTNGEKNEQFHVLKSDKQTRHGEYQKFSLKNKLLIKGVYSHGVKDSVWEFYSSNGQINAKYDYSKNELVYFKYDNFNTQKEHKVIKGSSSIMTTLSRPPLLLGGSDNYANILIKNLQYPQDARENRITGLVHVLFTINKSGQVSDYRIEKPLGYGIDDEAIRVSKLLEEYWVAGIIDNQTVDVEMRFPFYFQLQ